MQKFYFILFFSASLVNFSGFGQNFVGTKLALFPDKENRYVDDLTFDSKGFIWFLSKGEIFRFNGYKSVSLMKTLPEEKRQREVFNYILMDAEDRLWIAGIQKLYVFDLKTWKLREFPQEKLPRDHDLEILDIKKSPRNQIFVRYNNGSLAIIANTKVHIVSNLYSHTVQSQLPTTIWSLDFWKNRAWLGSTSGKLYSIGLEPDHRIKTYVIDKFRTTIAEIVPQRDHLLLIDLWHSKFYKFHFKTPNGSFVAPIEKQFSEEAIWAKNWGFWAEKNKKRPSTKQEFQKRKDFITYFLQQNDIADVNAIEVLNRDLFFATSDGIWAIYEKTTGVSTLIPNNTINSSVRDIYQFEDGSLFFCTYGGAEYIQKNGETHYFKDFFAGYNILSLDKNQILISIQGDGVKVFDKRNKSFRSLNYIVPKTSRNKGTTFPKYVLSLAQDEQFIYLGTISSLFRLNKKSRILEPLLERPQGTLSKFRVNHISIQKNGLFLSTSLGFMKFDHGKLGKIFPKKRNLGIYKHIFHRDTIWLATKGMGLVGIDRKGEILKTVDKKSGLDGNIAYNLELANGYKVIGTNMGLSIVKQSKIITLNRENGLVQNEFNHSASFYSPDTQKLYMGGLQGYSVLDMSETWIEKNEEAKNQITQISIVNPEKSSVGNNYTVPYHAIRNLEIEPSENILKISLGNPKSYKTSQRLRYKVTGLVNTWQAVPKGNEISLMGLSPGNHTLSIISDGSSANHLLQLDLYKNPTFYQTWFFKFIVLFFLLILFWFWHKFRLNSIKKEARLRSKIASDLHDDVGTMLTSISMQAEFLQISKKSSKNTSLKKIAVSSKNAIQAMGDIVWSLDARSDHWKNFIIKMREYGNQLFGDTSISFSLKVTGTPPKMLSQEKKQSIYLIYKEALNNSCKYSEATKVFAHLYFSKKQILLKIKDNGKGIDLNREKSGQGIKNMEMRAKNIKAFLKIINSNGLEITLEIPRQKKSPFWG